MGKNKMVLGLCVALTLALLAIGLRYLIDEPSVKTVTSDSTAHGSGKAATNDHHLHPQKLGVAAKGNTMTTQSPADTHDHDHDHKLGSSADADQPRHIDLLSDEMKQAIKDKLLLHGPMEVIRHPDGRIELPSNGRFTQMPVAVEMPDGSIQIREYSTLPE